MALFTAAAGRQVGDRIIAAAGCTHVVTVSATTAPDGSARVRLEHDDGLGALNSVQSANLSFRPVDVATDGVSVVRVRAEDALRRLVEAWHRG